MGLVVEAAAPEVEPLTGGSLELPSPVSHSGAEVETRARVLVSWEARDDPSPPEIQEGKAGAGAARRQ